MQTQAHILISIKRMVKKILNLKLVIMEEYKNIKKKLQRITFQIGLTKFK